MFNNNAQLINDVKIKKDELLTVLKNNLLQHRIDVTEAFQLRRNIMKDYFVSEYEKIDDDNLYDPKDRIEFPKPIDSSKDYERAIKMVEMTQDEIIELSEDQFDKLVMDNWNWKQSLISTSSIYGKNM